jgi:hypothetical protein
MHGKFLCLVGMTAHWDEGEGRVLMGNNAGAMADHVSVCWSLDISWTSLYNCQYVYWILPCAKYELHQTPQSVTTA